MTLLRRADIRLYWFALIAVFWTGIPAGCAKAPGEEESAPPPAGIEALDARFSQYASEEDFSGTVLAARGGEILLHKTYGPLASAADRAEPAYWIASNSKQFMGAAVAVLAGEGKIDLDAPIGTYLENVSEDKQGITARQLLTHMSGLDHQYATDGVVDRGEATAAILGLKLVNQPGEAYSYSNDGYTLLAIVAEIASGETYEEIMRRRVFEPAGLTSTGLWGFETEEAFIAPVLDAGRAQALGETIYVDGHSAPSWGFRGPTGIYSTTQDMYRWVVRLMEAHSDNADPLSAVTAPQQFIRETELSEIYYGFGVGVVKRGGAFYMISHSGDESELGHNSNVRAYADGDVIIVLSNAGYVDGRGWSSKVSNEVRDYLGK